MMLACVAPQAFPVLIDNKPENVAAFRAIANTMFTICLDSTSPATHVQVRQCVHPSKAA
jgi:hypothetical protein